MNQVETVILMLSSLSNEIHGINHAFQGNLRIGVGLRFDQEQKCIFSFFFRKTGVYVDGKKRGAEIVEDKYIWIELKRLKGKIVTPPSRFIKQVSYSNRQIE